ncbi:MAG TPA: ISKra4 family transposase, partial [Streptosporangiaceae bacterium]|nr:ISKra4 family transposase [Streptosporangiaceae bacterium]
AAIAAALRAAAAGLGRARRATAARTAGYLEAKAPYLDYPAALANGWPIATGVIEGACRHLVKDRMDITGARWGTQTADAILKLRALITNRDFDTYWDFHLQREHERTYPRTHALAA